MSLFVLGVSIAEPSAALRAVYSRRIIARLVVGRHCQRSLRSLSTALPCHLALLLYAPSSCGFSIRPSTYKWNEYRKFYLTERYVPCRDNGILSIRELFPRPRSHRLRTNAPWPQTWRPNASGSVRRCSSLCPYRVPHISSQQATSAVAWAQRDPSAIDVLNQALAKMGGQLLPASSQLNVLVTGVRPKARKTWL